MAQPKLFVTRKLSDFFQIMYVTKTKLSFILKTSGLLLEHSDLCKTENSFLVFKASKHPLHLNDVVPCKV